MTRQLVLQLAKEYHIKIEQRLFSSEEAYAVREALITSVTTLCAAGNR